jgi:predicted transposase YbfD/YdcC
MDSIFIECFGSLKDPRVERTKKHLLLDIITLALCGVIAGAQSWEEIEDFGNAHQDWLSSFLELPNGIPSHDTISRVFSVLEPKTIQECSINWLKRLKSLIPETVIPIDGKTLRRSGCKSTCQKALHVINAWSCANGFSLGQLKVEDKSNEITAVPEILKQLFIKGAIVTLDAMGCQEDAVAQICDAEADYVIALKGNQGELHELVKDSFDLLDRGAISLQPTTAKDEIDSQHGRIDRREIQVIDAAKLANMIDARWKGLNSIARVIYTSEFEGQSHVEKRFYISSLPTEKPLDILFAIRSHWQIESCLHWSLDVTFREDNCRIRDKNAALNMSWLRKFALGLLRNEKSFKRASIRRKQLKAWTSPSYLTEVLKQS